MAFRIKETAAGLNAQNAAARPNGESADNPFLVFSMLSSALSAIQVFLLAFPLCLSVTAQIPPIEVRHKHAVKAGDGELRFTDASVSFAEKGKRQKHSREWKYGEIQELVLRPDRLQIRTYNDIGWQLGRDREYDFELLSTERIAEIYPFLRARMDQRLVVAIAEPVASPLWQVNAKLLEGRGGSQGTVVVGEDHIVYKCERPGEARTWAINDIENVSSSGPFDLTFTTFERSASFYGNRREFRFQLKEALPEARYQALWQRITFSKKSNKENQQ
jgi:hypothetical protein